MRTVDVPRATLETQGGYVGEIRSERFANAVRHPGFQIPSAPFGSGERGRGIGRLAEATKGGVVWRVGTMETSGCVAIYSTMDLVLTKVRIQGQ